MSISQITGASIADASITSSDLPAGFPTSANMPAGSVVQIVQATYSTEQTIASESWNDLTGLTLNITPISASSKMLVMWSVQGQGNGSGFSVRCLRNGTSLFTPGSFYETFINTGIARSKNVHQLLDSPATTSQITYKLQAGTHSGGTVNFHDGSLFLSSITVLEIAG